MKKILNIKVFLTNREYWDHKGDNIPITNDDCLNPNKAFITYDDGTTEYVDRTSLV